MIAHRVPDSFGKLRRLHQCADRDGKFLIMAADQRGNLRRALDPQHPDRVPALELTRFKVNLMASLASAVTAVLLDPEYGAAQAIAAGALDPGTGLIVALEQTGYAGTTHDRRSRILPGWSAGSAAALGASAAKLLVYYHPDAPSAAGQVELVMETAAACAAVHLPLIVEPLSFSLGSEPLDGPQRREVVAASAATFGAIEGVDLLKLEFPSDPATPDTWEEACRQVDEASPVPWVLLSSGVGFDTFARMAKVACTAGASGVLAGRAIWKESVPMPPHARRAFYETSGRERLRRLGEVVSRNARPWWMPTTDPISIPPDWFRDG